MLRESFRQGARVGLPMLPTLVFTLVLALQMREQFEPSAALYGGLVIYALTNSLVVSLIFKSQQPDYSADMLEDGLEKLKRSQIDSRN